MASLERLFRRGSVGRRAGLAQNNYVQAVNASNPVAFYPMTETGGTTAFDWTSNANNGTYNTYHGGTFTLNQPGPTLYGLPSTSAVAIASPNNNSTGPAGAYLAAAGSLGNNFSAEVWFDSTATNDGRYLNGYIYSRNCTNGTAFDVGIDGASGIATSQPDTLFFLVGNSTIVPTGVVITPGTWYDLLATYNGTTNTASLYLNGVDICNTTPSVAMQTSTADAGWFGLRESDSAWGFNGNLAEASVYNTVLSQTDASAHYDAAIGASGWLTNGGGTWSTSANWSGGVPGTPTGLTAAAFGPGLTTGTANVTLDLSSTLSSLNFNTTGANSYVIAPSSGSTLTLSNSLGSATIANGGGNHTIAVPITLASNLSVSALPGSTLSVSGPIGETGGSQSLSLGGGGMLVLGGANTYSGSTTLSGGTLQVGNGLALQNSTVVAAGGGLDLNGFNATVGGLSGAYSLTLNSGTLNVGNNNADTTYGGILGGTVSLVKTGAGTLTLANANTYTGPTVVNAGTLAPQLFWLDNQSQLGRDDQQRRDDPRRASIPLRTH